MVVMMVTVLFIKKRLFSSTNLKEMAEGILKGDRSSLARGITLGKKIVKNKSSFYPFVY